MTVIVSTYDDGDYVEADYSADYDSTLIFELNFLTKRIILNSGVRSYHPVDDMYPEIRNIIARDTSLQLTDHPMSSQGNEPTGPGKFTPRRGVFQFGWRVRLADESQVFKVLGEQITDDGGSGAACMDLDNFSDGTTVFIEYAPPAAEIITVDGGGGTVADTSKVLLEVVPSIFIAQ